MQESAIEKTRREPAQAPPTVAPPRGVLKTKLTGGDFFHQRLAPPRALAPFVQHFWFVQWDLRRANPSTAETLPHPNCYLAFEHDLERPDHDPCVHQRAEIYGVTTGKFSRTMQGQGRVFGVKFQPGGLRPFLRSSISELTDRIVPASQVFGPDVLPLATQLRALHTPQTMAAAVSAYLDRHRPPLDRNTALAVSLVAAILDDPTILTVDALVKRGGLGIRVLQRLFKEYVGVSPKWVIRRFRLHELLEHFHSGEALDGAQLALDLGYSDQAHLINDFRKLAGFTPTEYLRRSAPLSPNHGSD